jgi:hypothetical protein
MAEFDRQVPQPEYDYEISRLVRYYQQAVRDILVQLERVDLTNATKANQRAVLADIAKVLSQLDVNASAWVEANIPIAAREGVASTLVTLGLAQTFDEAMKVVEFNRLNRHMIETAVADTQNDLLQITQNMDRKIKTAIRQSVAEVMRSNMSQGINGRKTISREILSELRKQLGDSVNTGIVDQAGRRWKPETYAEMVTRTKMMRTRMDATINEAVGREAYYGTVSRNGSKHEECRVWEGKIVKLVREAPGDYPYIGDLRNQSRGLFHPNCQHQVLPVRDPNLLPQSIKDINGL